MTLCGRTRDGGIPGRIEPSLHVDAGVRGDLLDDRQGAYGTICGDAGQESLSEPISALTFRPAADACPGIACAAPGTCHSGEALIR